MKGLDESAKSEGQDVIKSVYSKQDQILKAIISLHCPEGFQADLTYGNGSFWKALPEPPIRFDIEPQKNGVTKADSRQLPLKSNSLSNAVFDPPFLTYIKNGRTHKDGKVAMSARFGGYWKYEELIDHYTRTLLEVKRVLRSGGHLVMKCQDIIHNHRMHCTHQKTIEIAERVGLRLKDLFILPATRRMPSPQKGQQRHARVFHCYFLVLEKKPERPSRKRKAHKADLQSDALLLQGLSSAILGSNDEGVIVYSYEKIISHFVKGGMIYEDAVEWVDYNVMPLANHGAGFTICYESNSIEEIDTSEQPVDPIDTEKNCYEL